MDDELLMHNPSKVVEKLNKTTRRIQKERRNIKKAEKEAAEFKEIQKLLDSTDDNLEAITTEPESSSVEVKSSDCSIIPVNSPGAKVFHDDLIFSLFNENNCHLNNFINSKEKCLIFGKNELIPSEECFRKLIAYHVTENLIPEEGSCSSISLHVLYLMSVHQDLNFVDACFDFLAFQKFPFKVEDIFPIFINFGAKPEDLFVGENLLQKFYGNKNEEITQNVEFPFYNMEMVGRILLQYITNNLFEVTSSIKFFIRGLVKITLDPKIQSGPLLPLYSTIITVLCAKIQTQYRLEEILDWVYLGEEHLLNQLEICRIISRPIFSDLQEGLVLKVLSEILKSEILYTHPPPIKINHIKSVLEKLRNRELSALELYSLLQLINGSLPGLTATLKDSTKINTLLASLEQKISKTVDSVDLIRLKLEIAKVGNLVTNNINNRFTVDGKLKKKSPVKKVKCSN